VAHDSGLDLLNQLLASEDFEKVTITFRGIGEMVGDKNAVNTNPSTSWMDLSPFESDEVWNAPRLRESRGDTTSPRFLGHMDQAAIQLAQTVAGSASNIEYFLRRFLARSTSASRKGSRRIGNNAPRGGTLWIGTDPSSSVLNLDGQFHDLKNAYAAGPAVFPALGSANPSLTAFTLARRTARAITQRANPLPHPAWFLC